MGSTYEQLFAWFRLTQDGFVPLGMVLYPGGASLPGISLDEILAAGWVPCGVSVAGEMTLLIYRRLPQKSRGQI